MSLQPFLINIQEKAVILNKIKYLKGYTDIESIHEFDVFKGTEYKEGDLVTLFNTYICSRNLFQVAIKDSKKNSPTVYLVIRKKEMKTNIKMNTNKPIHTQGPFVWEKGDENLKSTIFKEKNMKTISLKAHNEDNVYFNILHNRLYLKAKAIHDDSVTVTSKDGNKSTSRVLPGKYIEFYHNIINCLDDNDVIIFVVLHRQYKLKIKDIRKGLIEKDSSDSSISRGCVLSLEICQRLNMLKSI